MKEICIFIIRKEVSDDLKPATKEQKEELLQLFKEAFFINSIDLEYEVELITTIQ